ncbi:EVE domain-containing protein [Shewanella sp. SR44-3]|uniref:EVE domain-containing protein n=1 Tax=Shewanella sp. SR44-3 TaxID=2760936 RepID=UPI0015F9D825|nr:EVE domain-containing protein [Shewanella sp. SR44-3]MBB1268015.1 EVE domain-containing protein [Shewanella sp. SR44-3]
MNYWLMKSEPHDCSIDDINIRAGQALAWQGIRNYQARNFLRDQVHTGDKVFFYHSSCKEPGIVGIVEVVSDASADLSAFDNTSPYFDAKSNPEKPRWYSVDLLFSRKFSKVISLKQLKADPALAEMVLVAKGARLSVQPVTAKEWQHIIELAGE